MGVHLEQKTDVIFGQIPFTFDDEDDDDDDEIESDDRDDDNFFDFVPRYLHVTVYTNTFYKKKIIIKLLGNRTLKLFLCPKIFARDSKTNARIREYCKLQF